MVSLFGDNYIDNPTPNSVFKLMEYRYMKIKIYFMRSIYRSRDSSASESLLECE